MPDSPTPRKPLSHWLAWSHPMVFSDGRVIVWASRRLSVEYLTNGGVTPIMWRLPPSDIPNSLADGSCAT